MNIPDIRHGFRVVTWFFVQHRNGINLPNKQKQNVKWIAYGQTNTYVVWVAVNSQYCTVNRIFPDQNCNRWTPYLRIYSWYNFIKYFYNKILIIQIFFELNNYQLKMLIFPKFSFFTFFFIQIIINISRGNINHQIFKKIIKILTS